jgi:hypothetical protein
MRTEESGSAGDQGTLFAHEVLEFLEGMPAPVAWDSGIAGSRPTL